eukprot:gene13842-15288_t
MVFVGGSDADTDLRNFKDNGANIIVATPGRLLDLLQRNTSDFDLRSCLKKLEVLVLDEADRLLDMGFKTSINTILSHLPKQRRTGLFSATQTEETEDLVRAGLRNPVTVVVKQQHRVASSDERTPETLENFYMICESDEKFTQLVAFLRMHKDAKHIIFFNTCACVEYFSRMLKLILKKADILSLHGKMKGRRAKIFDEFREKQKGLMICTDVMARGVDIPEVNWVIQYDPPSNPSAFLHRCGRTARIGNAGNALVFLQPCEASFVEFVKINQKVPLQTYEKLRDIPSMVPKLKKLASKERDLYEKGIRAYVSFIQAYKKHECSLIFSFKELNFVKIADGFGLLQLPKMPELTAKNTAGFSEYDVDVNSIPYRDKIREKQRQLRLIKEKEEKISGEGKSFTKKEHSWSKDKEKKMKKEQRKLKKENKKRKLKHSFDDADIDELSKEVGLMKKLKRGKISKEEFDMEVKDDEEFG